MGLQSCESPNFRNFQNFGIPNLGVLGQNDIWLLALWPSIENRLKGRWWHPPSLGHGEYCEFVFVNGLFVHQRCSNYALTNLLFDLCRSM